MAPGYMTHMFSIPENQTYQVIAEKLPLTKIPETSIRSFKKLIEDLCI